MNGKPHAGSTVNTSPLFRLPMLALGVPGSPTAAVLLGASLAIGFVPSLVTKSVNPVAAGITTYSPLRTWNVGPGSRVGVIGLGGLGHMAVKLAAAMGARYIVETRGLPRV